MTTFTTTFFQLKYEGTLCLHSIGRLTSGELRSTYGLGLQIIKVSCFEDPSIRLQQLWMNQKG
ncbi:hypothetical protein An04g00330 [Aspergillus niger]|uniref:Uncharacterized protein n=2 Tax=Aspergillus niger TaxID=5061 RepID=A2QHL8_ASPNC|nr:hypothetical protein An04g00330 [Aspergillus niger]CAK38488.1 hypothetical protein An04g00330 [Aspergillus niger]